ncbi:MAG: hypothetical protein CSA26_05795 [Desulfobacterales bacterium]|nr:MAG: hypothetical protein CSA26_05795 [Desulfobacterales bacterium]
MSNSLQDINTIGPVQQAEPAEDQRSQAQKDYEEGRGYVERGESALAAVSLHNALQGFEKEGNKEGIANASNQLGHACLQRKEYEKALENYQRAWDICAEFDDPTSLQALSVRRVEAYAGLKAFGKAVGVCLDLIDEYQKNNDPQGTVTVLEMMADIYQKSGDLDKAADSYRTIASIHANFNHPKIAEAYRQKAEQLNDNNA